MALQRLLGVLVDSAQREPTALVVDDFSSISAVTGAAGALRTALQHHYRDLGIVFAGSQPSMTRALFTDRPAPFYGQADLFEVGPLSAAAVDDIVAAGFATTGRDAAHLPGRVFAFTAGHPQRTMQLADACWRATAVGTVADDEVFAAGLGEVCRMSADAMERLYSGFERGERDVLRAVARSGSIYGAHADLLGLSAGAASHARRTLLDSGDLADSGSGLAVVDPVLADWVRQRFPL